MKSLEDFIKTNRNDKLSACLIEELKKGPNCDDDFIYGVLVYTKNDTDKREMIKFIQKGEDVTYEQVVLNALWLNQQRKNKKIITDTAEDWNEKRKSIFQPGNNKMDLTKYIEDEIKNNELSRELVIEMKKFSEGKDFIAGVLLDVENDEDKATLLDYIKNGEDVNYEQIILNSLWLSQQREKQDALFKSEI